MLTLEGLQGLGGTEVPVRDLVELNKALKKNGMYKAGAVAGYPTAMSGANSEFAPLIPQSIQNVLDSASFTEQMVRLFKLLPKIPVGSTLHESVVTNEHGSMHLDPWIAEGGGGIISTANYSRKTVQVKFLSEKRQLSDVAAMVQIIGNGQVSKQGLALETQAGTTALLGKLERSLFGADQGLSSLAFNGIHQQYAKITWSEAAENDGTQDTKIQSRAIGASSDNFLNMDGAALTAEKIMDGLYRIYSAPSYAIPSHVLVEPRTYANLQAVAFSSGRFALGGGAPASPVTLYQGQLMIAGPTGAVPIVSCPLLLPADTPPTASVPADDVVSVAIQKQPFAQANGGVAEMAAWKDTAGVSGASAKSWFGGDDNGIYFYKIVKVNSSGHSAPVTSTAVTIAAAGFATWTMNDAATSDAQTYYRVYRSDKGGTAATCKYAFSVPASRDDSLRTQIVDDNSQRPSTAPAYILQITPDVVQWVQLLDFLRRPLAQTATSVPFLLMLMGAPFVKIPTKGFVFDGCKLGSNTGIG